MTVKKPIMGDEIEAKNGARFRVIDIEYDGDSEANFILRRLNPRPVWVAPQAMKMKLESGDWWYVGQLE